MPVIFETIKLDSRWDRKQLAQLWGYNGRQGLDHGVVTPKNDNKIILFITHEKQSHSKQFKDILNGNTVQMDGQPSHRTDDRLIHAADRGDEIHLFYRDRPLQQFTYYGQVFLQTYERNTNEPSKFSFSLSTRQKETQLPPIDLPEPPSRCEAQISRIIRDTPLARELKSLYGFACQVCGLRIEPAPNSFYVEVHHVRPLGGSHAGLDIQANMLVLCPNHHAMFDYGIPYFLSPQRIEIAGVTHDLIIKHELSSESIAYHNTKIKTVCEIAA
ncbi:MAG TPA: HNH endonuclease [Verrucomicrobiae bacterium]|jgi:predicted restriction endonuclease|nr:HNH endonuclease [Verrucomicrobiae bacterium]